MHIFHLSSFKSLRSFSLPPTASFCISLLSYPIHTILPQPLSLHYTPRKARPTQPVQPHSRYPNSIPSQANHAAITRRRLYTHDKNTRSLHIIQSSNSRLKLETPFKPVPKTIPCMISLQCFVSSSVLRILLEETDRAVKAVTRSYPDHEIVHS